MKQVELLFPAGTPRNMRYAFAFGADAVYAGQPRYSLRVRNNDFLAGNLAKGINEAHKQGKKFFLATNVIPHNAKVKTFLADIAPIIAMKPDALIMADAGLIMMTREAWPDIYLKRSSLPIIFKQLKLWVQEGFYLLTKSGFHLVEAVVNGGFELMESFVIAIVKALLLGEFPQPFDQIQIRRIRRQKKQVNSEFLGLGYYFIATLITRIVLDQGDGGTGMQTIDSG
jgi:hypothetical protein